MKLQSASGSRSRRLPGGGKERRKPHGAKAREAASGKRPAGRCPAAAEGRSAAEALHRQTLRGLRRETRPVERRSTPGAPGRRRETLGSPRGGGPQRDRFQGASRGTGHKAERRRGPFGHPSRRVDREGASRSGRPEGEGGREGVPANPGRDWRGRKVPPPESQDTGARARTEDRWRAKRSPTGCPPS